MRKFRSYFLLLKLFSFQQDRLGPAEWHLNIISGIFLLYVSKMSRGGQNLRSPVNHGMIFQPIYRYIKITIDDRKYRENAKANFEKIHSLQDDIY